MKKWMTIALCLAMVLGSGCGAGDGNETAAKEEITAHTTTAEEVISMEGLTLLEQVSQAHSPKAAGDAAMENMICVSSKEMRGTHDAQFICANGKAYIVYEANNEMAGENGTYAGQYSALAVVDLNTFTLESVEKFAYGGQKYANTNITKGSAFVPRVIQKDEYTLRFFFANIIKDTGEYIYYVDYDLATATFDDEAYRLKIMTPEGEKPLTAELYIKLFRADGHACLDKYFGLYLFDIFEIGDTKYIALNNFETGQNSLAKFNDTYDCIEIVGNIGGVYDSVMTTESGIVQRADGTWMAILRNERGDKNYRFSYSEDGKVWSEPVSKDFLQNGTHSKPTLTRYGDYYFMGWNEYSREIFHLAYSKDGESWTPLYSFYAPTTFQYPEFEMYNGQMYFSVTTGSKEQICFGKLPIYERDGKIYIEEHTEGVEARFRSLEGFSLLSDSVQTNDSGTCFATYVKRDAEGVYFYGESKGYMTVDKLFFLLDTQGTANALDPNSSPSHLMFRFYTNVQVQATFAEGVRSYKKLSLCQGVEFFKREDADGTKVGIFIPYDAIQTVAPNASPVNGDVYVMVYGADGNSNNEYVPQLAGKTQKWDDPSTYAALTESGEIKVK